MHANYILLRRTWNRDLVRWNNRICVKKWAYLSYARISAGTNARLQIAGLLLFPGCHWSIQKVMSYVKLSLFKTKPKSEWINGSLSLTKFRSQESCWGLLNCWTGLFMRSARVLCRYKLEEEVESWIGCRYVCRAVVTQLGRGLDVVYFVLLLVQCLWAMYCRLFIWLKPERFMGLSVIDKPCRSLGFRQTHLETYKNIICDSYPWAPSSQTWGWRIFTFISCI